jgi:Lhr-like helicase
MKKIQQRTIRVVVADTEKPSPFAGSLLFRYVANFIYDGDAPLARISHSVGDDARQPVENAIGRWVEGARRRSR